MAKWDNPIGIPFAENGDRSAIPDTSESGDVNNTTGFGNKYEIDPAVGGLWLYRQTMNSLFYNMFSSIKEIQTKVPISVNGSTPDASGNISITMPTADGGGIKIIDDNTPDITSYNQITEDGIYYIYKTLSDGPDAPIKDYIGCINLTVLNIKSTSLSADVIIQLISFNVDGYSFIPSNIGITPMTRVYNKPEAKWEDWDNRYGILFALNNVVMNDFTTDKIDIRFPIIARDTTIQNSYNTFMYSTTKEQMREQLGIKDDSGDVDKDIWKTYTTTIVGTKQRCKSAMYKIYNREINGYSYRCISIIAVISADITISDINLYSLTLGVPEGIKIYEDGIALKNGGISSKTYSLNGMDAANIGGTAVNVAPCYMNCISDRVWPSFSLFTSLSTGEVIQSAIITFQVDALIDDRTLAPTPASIAVTKIQGNQVTITYTRGS